MLKFEKGACFFISITPIFIYFSAKAGQDSSTFFSTCAEKMQFYCSSRTYYAIPYCTIFSILTPHYALRRVHYITLHIYIANCNRINSVWVQCDNTAAKLFIGLLYKCNKFQKKNCPKTTGKCCYVFLETKEN